MAFLTRWFLIFVIFGLLVACANSNQKIEVNISGRLYNPDTNLPVSNWAVSLSELRPSGGALSLQSKWHAIDTAMTDEVGNFSLYGESIFMLGVGPEMCGVAGAGYAIPYEKYEKHPHQVVSIQFHGDPCLSEEN